MQVYSWFSIIPRHVWKTITIGVILTSRYWRRCPMCKYSHALFMSLLIHVTNKSEHSAESRWGNEVSHIGINFVDKPMIRAIQMQHQSLNTVSSFSTCLGIYGIILSYILRTTCEILCVSVDYVLKFPIPVPVPAPEVSASNVPVQLQAHESEVSLLWLHLFGTHENWF
jgi:hypothetical protein